MLRRLGFESIVAAFVKTCCPNAKFFINEPLINWKFVHTIPNKSLKENLQLKLSNQDLKQMHPADLADILEDLDNTNRKEILEELSPELAAQTLSELEPDVQNQLIKYENPIKIAQYVEHMGTDEAADLLSDFSEDKTDAIISNIQDNDFQEEVQELLEYEENTAGGLMSTEVFDVNKNFSRSTIIKKIQEEHDNLDSIYDIYVTDPEEKLLGTCSLSKILIEVEDIKIQELMNIEDIKSLHHSTPWRDVAEYMSKYNLITVPITDDENKLLGVVTVDDILPWLLNQR
jgi:Mg/Co/Ni transporter MgtE